MIWLLLGFALAQDADGDGFDVLTDCDDSDPTVYPGAIDLVGDGVDSDCMGGDACYEDVDGDSHGSSVIVGGPLGCVGVGVSTQSTDCDDLDSDRYPGNTEVPASGKDDDCDGLELCPNDLDGDGWPGSSLYLELDWSCPWGPATDCDDADPNIHPGAVEVPGTSIDEDCDGQELCYRDRDGDGFSGDSTELSYFLACDYGPIASVDEGDCNDNPADGAGIHPGATEVVDALDVDENCDGVVACFGDADGDGTPGSGLVLDPDLSCAEPGQWREATDCDDADPGRFPGNAEVCDGLDSDCIDGADNGLDFEAYWPDLDGDGAGDQFASSVSTCDGPPINHVANSDDCDDTDPTIHTGAYEIPGDGIDQDCISDPLAACFEDLDLDGFGSPLLIAAPDGDCDDPGEAYLSTDCDDSDALVFPGSYEVCDGLDNDCDGEVDENLPVTTYWPDQDGDGFGDASQDFIDSCGQVPGHVLNDEDCNDTDPSIQPGGPEYCDTPYDDNCNGLTDDVVLVTVFPDLDEDGFGDDQAAAQVQCEPLSTWQSLVQGDCDDADPTVYGSAVELCDGVDNNCDDHVDEGCPPQDTPAETGHTGMIDTGSGSSASTTPTTTPTPTDSETAEPEGAVDVSPEDGAPKEWFCAQGPVGGVWWVLPLLGLSRRSRLSGPGRP